MNGGSDNNRSGMLGRTCCGCGLFCDDVRIERVGRGGGLVADQVCQWGRRWLEAAEASAASGGWPAGSPGPGSACRLAGRPVEMVELAGAVRQWLDAAALPLFAGMEFLSVEAQQAMVRLVQQTGGWIGPTLDGEAGGELALSRHGRSSATLGEPAESPGLLLLVTGPGAFVPPRLFTRFFSGCTERWLAGVMPEPAEVGDQIAEGDWQQILTGRAGVLDGLPELSTRLETAGDQNSAGEWGRLAEAIRRAGALHVIAEGWSEGAGSPDPVLDCLHRLVVSWNRRFPAWLWLLDGRCNARGAFEVLAWSFGAAMGGLVAEGRLAVPAGSGSARRKWESGQWDLLLCAVGSGWDCSPAMESAIRERGSRRFVFLGPANHPLAGCADAVVPVAETGWDDAGDVVRLDGLMVRAERVVESPGRVSAAGFFEAVAGAGKGSTRG